jgi:hypothetical protein
MFIYLYIIFVGDITSKKVGLSFQLPLSTTNETVKNSISSSVADEALYLHTAFDVADGRPLDDLSKFSLRQWAPGMPITLAGLLLIFHGAPLGISWLFLLLLLWTVVFTTVIFIGKTIIAKSLNFIIFSIVLQTDIFKNWIFSDGFYYSEGISTGFFSLFVVHMNKNRHINKIPILISSLALFLALFYKASIEYVVFMLTILSLLFLLKLQFEKDVLRRFSKKLKYASYTDQTKKIKLILISSLVCLLFTIPWRIVSSEKLYPNENYFGWTNQSTSYWGHRWMHPDWLEERKIGWFIEGKGNSACLLDMELCNEIYKIEVVNGGGDYSGTGHFSQAEFRTLAIQTYANHPIKTFTNRIEPFSKHWFTTKDKLDFNNVFSLVILISVLFISIKMFSNTRLFGDKIVILFSVLGGTIGPLILQSIENRYLYLVKLVIVLYIIDFMNKSFFKGEVKNDLQD